MLGAIFAMFFFGDVVQADVRGEDMILTDAAEWACKQVSGKYHDGTTNDVIHPGVKWEKIIVPVGGNGKNAVEAWVPLCEVKWKF